MNRKLGDNRIQSVIELISDRKTWFSKAVIKVVLVRSDNNDLHVFEGRIDFLYKSDDDSNEFVYDYGHIILIKLNFTIPEIIHWIKSLQGGFMDFKYFNVVFEGGFDDSYTELSSMTHYVDIFPQWPALYIHHSINSKSSFNVVYEPLVKSDLPAYPNLSEGIISFLELERKFTNNTPHGFHFVIPDYRGRISTIEISKNVVELFIENRELPIENMLVKIFSKNEKDTSYAPDDLIIENNGKVKFEIPFVPSLISIYLLDKNLNEIIDFKEFGSYRTTRHEGIFIKTSKQKLESLIAKGENEIVEFKEDLGKDEFLETIVSFANTHGGYIILGVDNRGNLVGFHDDFRITEQKIRGMISGRCEPQIEVKIEQLEIENKPVVVVTVQEGVDKPYLVRNKGPYLRIHEDDVVMSRHDIDNIYAKKQPPRTPFN